MARKKYKGKSKASVEADKKKSLSDIEKTRRKLDAIKGRELNSIRESAKDMIELNRAIQDLDRNKEEEHKVEPIQFDFNEDNLKKMKLTEILNLIEIGNLTPTLDREISFEQAAEAHRYLENRRNFGKVVLIFS